MRIGDFTFYKGDKKSQSDILIANLKGIKNIQTFKIKQLPWNPSDYVPISTKICTTIKDKNVRKLVSEDILSTAGLVSPRKPKKIRVDSVNWETYNAVTRSDFDMFCVGMEGKISRMRKI